MIYTYDKELADAVQAEILHNMAFADLKDCRIAVLYCEQDKKRNGMTVYADTKKLSDMHSYISGYDFVITFYEKSSYMSEAVLKVLIEHELRHIGIESRGGAVRWYIIPHDVQDFREIIEAHGINWALK